MCKYSACRPTMNWTDLIISFKLFQIFFFLFRSISELTKNIPKNPEDLNTVMLPLYHTFGISSIFDNMVRGLRFILVPHFTFKNMLEAIQEYKVWF